MQIHSVCYTFLLCFLGFSLAIIYGLTHDVDSLRVYKIVYEQPAPQSQPRVTNAADIFSAVDERQ